jgi:ABC-type multidrug transport system ATPase subunit
MEEAAALCDQIAIMDRGHVIARGSPRSLVEALGLVQFIEFECEHSFDEGVLAALEAVEGLERRGRRYRLTIGRSLSSLTTVLEAMDREGIVPVGLNTHPATLDDVFVELTGRELQPGGEPT